MNIHPDFIFAIAMAVSILIGFIFGRLERREAYLEAYNRGKAVQAAVAARTANNILESLGER